MPDNNRKVLSKDVLKQLREIYSFEYNENTGQIITRLTTCNRVTKHVAFNKFSINCKRLRKKITFSLDAINIWKETSKEKQNACYSLFDINNIINKLKIMHISKPNKKLVLDMLTNNFQGIKEI